MQVLYNSHPPEFVERVMSICATKGIEVIKGSVPDDMPLEYTDTPGVGLIYLS